MAEKKSAQIYIGRLSKKTAKDDLEKSFGAYGKLKDVVLKNGFAFITFEDLRDAEDAVKEMNDHDFLGEKITVELAGQRRHDRSRARGPQPDDKCFNCGERGHWYHHYSGPMSARKKGDLDTQGAGAEAMIGTTIPEVTGTIEAAARIATGTDQEKADQGPIAIPTRDRHQGRREEKKRKIKINGISLNGEDHHKTYGVV